jgi:hypothetical protein
VDTHITEGQSKVTSVKHTKWWKKERLELRFEANPSVRVEPAACGQ